MKRNAVQRHARWTPTSWFFEVAGVLLDIAAIAVWVFALWQGISLLLRS